MATPLRVVLAGGGTGGHLYPALNLAEELARVEGVRVMLVGARRGIDADVLPRRGHPYRLLPVEPLYRRRPWRNLRSAAAFARSLRQTDRIFAEFPPDVVVGTGGYAAAPVLARAVRTGIPVAIQEQNSAPGITTRWFARRAGQVHLAYPEARGRVRTRPGAKVTIYGNPIRWPATPPSGEEARRTLGLAPGPVVLVVGGSQGARALNEAIAACVAQVRAGALPSLPRGAQLYWATGPAQADAIARRLAELGPLPWVRTVPYVEPMENALAVATLAVSRAGAMAVAEMCAWSVPMLLVPFPHAAGDHQRRNAEALAAAGAARVWTQDAIEREPARLWSAVCDLLADEPSRRRMAEAARARGRPDAVRRIAADVLELARGRAALRGRG